MLLRFLLALSLISFSLCSAENGVVVAFTGLSGCGKTTMAKKLEQLCECKVLTEPEEPDWPEVCTRSSEFGTFSMWMGFRQLWIPQQYTAQTLKSQNQLVIIDSFFIKIIGYELSEPGMEWLFPRDDAYFSVFNQICQLDIDNLPDPDYIVLIDVSFDNWIKLLDSRDRAWDKTPGFVESYESTKRAIQNAVELLCKVRNIKLLRFQQEFGDPTEQAAKLKTLLIENNIL